MAITCVKAFQFHKVQLKGENKLMDAVGVSEFQFHKVQLKVRNWMKPIQSLFRFNSIRYN
ncbi:MAG: hypothetical protein H6Q13_1345 [Bacteroidetes bacterium]|nr:hypothetical protein [Bacteroidota bacterium]